MPYFICSPLNAPNAFLTEREVSLKKGVKYEDIYKHFTVNENIKPQTCTAFIKILSPYEDVISKDFEIINDPSFNFKIKISKKDSYNNISKTDLNSNIKKIFIKNDNIYLDYKSDVSSPEINANLIYPDKSMRKIILPASIIGSQIGTYEIQATAVKTGYKSVSVKEQFGVIDKKIAIKSFSSCNADGICSKNENFQNCPQDCNKPKYGELLELNNIIILVLLIIFVVIIFIIAFSLLKRKRRKKKR